MGMFGSRKKTYVSSVVYNLAGDENERPNYLKTTVIGSVMNQSRSLGQDITNSYLAGPAMRFRGFARWARRTGYVDLVGQVTGQLTIGDSINDDVLREQIPHEDGESVSVQLARIGAADYSYWAEAWMFENHPEQVEDDWTADIVDNVISISFDGTVAYTFTADDFDPNSRYLYTTYVIREQPTTGPVVEGPVVTLNQGEEFPSRDGWTEVSDSPSLVPMELKKTTKTDVTYSDGRPPETNTVEETNEIDYSEEHTVDTKTEFMGVKPGGTATYDRTSTMYQDTVGDIETTTTENSVDEDIGGGVIKTTKTIVIEDQPVAKRSYRIDTQDTILASWGDPSYFIYKFGSGNAALDAMFAVPTTNQDFFPYIPFRIDNKFISETYMPDVYEASKKAFKKATTGSYDDTVDTITDNESLKDIDYAYAVFGVSLNVKEDACKQYIYRFFQAIIEESSVGDDGSYTEWKLQYNQAQLSVERLRAWEEAQKDSSDPLYGTPQPTRIPYPEVPLQSINIRSDKESVMNYNITISWASLEDEVFSGLARPDAKVGELFFDVLPTESFEVLNNTGGSWKTVDIRQVNTIQLVWQETPTRHRKMTIRDLQHRNEIYKGKAVEIDGREALDDPEESGFIIPLHEGIYRSMPITRSTQMSTACAFIVFNCYQVVKKKWYQTGLFKVILIVIIIVVSIYFPPAGGASAGILGTNVAVGTAIGLTGTAALIVGAIANAIAAMILVSVIQRGATALFGDKLGTIIGAIASVIALNVGTSLATGQSMSAGFGSMMKADNLLRLTQTGLDTYAKYINISTQEIIGKTQDLLENYAVESARIASAYADEFGTDKGFIDPLTFTDAARGTYVPEGPEAFLERTLMLGTDIVDLSMEMLANFADLTTNTNLQI